MVPSKTPFIFTGTPSARKRWLEALERTVQEAERLTERLSQSPCTSQEATILRIRLLAMSREIAALRADLSASNPNWIKPQDYTP